MKKDLLAEREQTKYQKLWDEFPQYRKFSPGEISVGLFLSCAEIKEGDRVIDFGCGTGRVARHFLEKCMSVTLVDFCTDNCLDPEVQMLRTFFPDKVEFIQGCLWDLPDEVPKGEWFYCCDVMEHIPEEKIEAVLGQIASRCQAGFITICLKKDNFGIEEPLHICLKSQEWWEAKLLRHWQIEKRWNFTEEGSVQYFVK